ncbi:MAG: hypothetical protein IJ766_01150 [Clostridia bacterium]|nr:hypothetical protein [Clostridia bacterium]
MRCYTSRPDMELVAGDDYTLKVPLRNADAPGEPVLSEGDTVKAVISAYDLSVEIDGTTDGDTAEFYLSAEKTQALADYENCDIHMCVHIYWAAGGRSTARFDTGYELPLQIVRCHHDE